MPLRYVSTELDECFKDGELDTVKIRAVEDLTTGAGVEEVTLWVDRICDYNEARIARSFGFDRREWRTSKEKVGQLTWSSSWNRSDLPTYRQEVWSTLIAEIVSIATDIRLLGIWSDECYYNRRLLDILLASGFKMAQVELGAPYEIAPYVLILRERSKE